ncbi:type II secretion system protein [Patescibacteria group bacterium]
MVRRQGFTLIETLIVVGILGLLAGIVMVALGGARVKARDTKRMADLNTFGRFLQLSCPMPDAGPGDYDIADLFAELKAKNPRIAQAVAKVPQDPKSGSDDDTGYRYVVSDDGKKCAFYANLENEDEEITRTNLTEPTPGGGTGTLRAASVGRNGSDIYFQVTN